MTDTVIRNAEFVDDEQFGGGELGLGFEETLLVARFHEHPRPSLFESDFEKGGPRKWLYPLKLICVSHRHCSPMSVFGEPMRWVTCVAAPIL
ncbi:MAG: hypothetical protein WA231_22525 [Methylocella sp.]